MGSFDNEVQELITYYGTLAVKHTAHRAFEEAARTIILERREARGQMAARERAEARARELEAKCSVAKETLEKLKDTMLKYAGLEGRMWAITVEVLAALEGGDPA